MYDQATRAKAHTIAEARGMAAAATVTGVGISTLKRWAKAEGWRTGRNRVTPSQLAAEKQEAAHPPTPRPFRDRATELAEDADLARRVFRQQGEAVLDGHGRPGWFKDAAVAWGIAQDKHHQYGAPVGGWQRGREFDWSTYLADNPARLARLQQMLDMLEERARQQQEGNGDGR
jgi:hypothetical protein